MNTEGENFEKIEFVDSPEQVESFNVEQEPVQNDVQEPVQPQETPEEPQQPQYEVESVPLGEQNTQQYSDQDIEGAVVRYLSERLGRELNSFDDIQSLTQPQFDERVKAIADFVSETGRDPQEWFAYQQLNPSEMDDLTVMRVQKALQYPNLSQDEINMLVNREYTINEDVMSEEDAQYTRLKLKMDAEAARNQVEEYRNKYSTPKTEVEQNVEPFVDETWVQNMQKEVDSFEGLEFDLGNGNTFTFGVDDRYRSHLKQQNANIENYFDPYIRQDGSWDYDLLNSHRAVIDNVDNIVAAAYRQGLGDGQKGVVQRAANVSTTSPNNESMRSGKDPIVQQLEQIIGGNNKLTFNV